MKKYCGKSLSNHHVLGPLDDLLQEKQMLQIKRSTSQKVVRLLSVKLNHLGSIYNHIIDYHLQSKNHLHF